MEADFKHVKEGVAGPGAEVHVADRERSHPAEVPSRAPDVTNRLRTRRDEVAPPDRTQLSR
jgi:hypothetical protein